jgi:hypothetical protein
MAAKVAVPLPTWAFNYNSPYSATYTDVPNCSVNYPTYSSYNMNAYINKANNPAFVDHALMGCCGQGYILYAYMNQYVVGGDAHLWKDMTHIWSMAIPDNINCPVGLFMVNAWAGCGYPPNYDDLGPSVNINTGLWIDKDHYLKVMYYNSSSYPPTEVENTGVDMSQYLYPASSDPMSSYKGHRYAVVYNDEHKKYDLYVDNTNSIVASLTHNALGKAALMYMNSPTYMEWFNAHGGIVNNYQSAGPGMYYSNSYAPGYNVYEQYNVYMSDWYGYKDTLNLTVVNALLNWNFKIVKPPKNSSYYGAMNYCNYLNSISLPGSFNRIAYGCISGNNLVSVNIGEGTTAISGWAINSYANHLVINIPKTATEISSNAISGTNVSAPKVSYNLRMRHNMFNLPTESSLFEHYELLTGITATGLPVKQPKPYDYSIYDNNRDPRDVAYHTCRRLPIITDNNGLWHFNWQTLNVQLVFNENVRKNVHANTVLKYANQITAGSYVLSMRSIEFPNFIVSQRCNFVYDAGFMYSVSPAWDYVSADPVVTLVNHNTGLFTDIPDMLDYTLVVQNINLPFNLITPGIIDIKVPNKPDPETEASLQYPFFRHLILNIPPTVEETLVHDGHYTEIACNYFPRNTAVNNSYCPCPNFSFYNVNYVNVSSNYNDSGASFDFHNCYNVFGQATPNSTPITIADNYIVTIGWYNGFDLSTHNLTFRYWRYGKNAYGLHTRGFPIEDEPHINTIINSDIVTVQGSLSNEVTICNLMNCIIPTLNSWLHTQDEDHFVVSNSILPPAINIGNWMSPFGQFKDCTGNVDVNIYGVLTGNNNTGYGNHLGLFANHSGTVNVSINVTPIPYTVADCRLYGWNSKYQNTSYMATGTIPLGNPNHINKLYISSTNISTPNRYGYAQLQGGVRVSVSGSVIDDVTIEAPMAHIDFTDCTVHAIHVFVPRLHHFGASGTIDVAVQPIINISNSVALTNINIPDSDLVLNIHRTGLGLETVAATIDHIYVSNSVTIIDTANGPRGLGYFQQYSDIDTPHMHIKAVSTADTSFVRFKGTSLRADVMAIKAHSFSESANLTTVTGLENCLFIGDGAFRNCFNLTSITVSPKCSIHPNAFTFYNQESRQYEKLGVNIVRADNVPVSLNVDYNVMINGELVDSRTVDAPNDFAPINNRIKVNAVYADSTEVPVNDYYIMPDFACSNNNPNVKHTLFAAGCIQMIDAPYKNCYYPNTTADNLDMSDSGAYGQYARVSNSVYGGTLFNSVYSMAGPYYKYDADALHSPTNIKAVILRGFEACHSLLSEHPYFEYVIMTNNSINRSSSNAYAFLNTYGQATVYYRDDGINTANSSKYYFNNAECSMLDLHTAGGASYQIGENGIKNCNVDVICLKGYGAFWYNAINNCPNLYCVTFAKMNDTSYSPWIYDNFIVNCPSLQYLELPRGVSYIFAGALNRSNLKTIKISSNCTVQENALPADCVITYY